LVGVSGSVLKPGKRGDTGPGSYRITRTYRDALVRAGAQPIRLMPVPDDRVPELLARVDCLLLTGGPDIDPQAYGEQPHATVRVMPRERQQFDFALAREALVRQMPTLGICLGAQELNVVLGGSLVQDIPSEVPRSLSHRQNALEQFRRGVHQIELVPGTRLAGLYGGQRTIAVNSAHHQAADGLGKGLVVAARSTDGVIEAFEAPALAFLIGVQFHPEMQTEPAGLHDGLFDEFVKECRGFAAKRR